MASRTTYGNTWWGAAWLQALTSIDYENRLPRGRTYLNQGRLDNLRLNPKTNAVEADVHGSAYYPYAVSVAQQPLPPTKVKRLVDDIARDPDLVASLLEGELPPAILERAEMLGIELFPKSHRSLKISCSCPDIARVCKHVAATIYAVSVSIDHDPFLVFRLRGVDLKAELLSRGIDVAKAVTVKAPTATELLARMTGDVGVEAAPEAASEAAASAAEAAATEGTATETVTAEDAAKTADREAAALALLRTLPYGTVESMGGRMFELLAPRLLLSQQKDFPAWLGKMLRRAARELDRMSRNAAAGTAPESDASSASPLTDEDGVAINDLPPAPPAVKLVGTSAARFEVKAGRKKEALNQHAFTYLEADPRAVRLAAPEVEVLYEVFRTALALMKAGALIPVVLKDRDLKKGKEKVLPPVLWWMPAMREESVAKLVDRLARGASPWLDRVIEAEWLEGRSDLTKTVLLVGLAANALLSAHALLVADAKFQSFAEVIFAGVDLNSVDCPWGDGEAETLARWLKPFLLGDLFPWVPVLTVRTARASDESQAGDVTVNFGILPHGARRDATPTLLSKLLTDTERTEDRFAALSCLKTLAVAAPVLDGIRTSGGKPVRLDGATLKDFLFEHAPHLKLLGAKVLLPERLKKLLKPRLLAAFGAGSDGGIKGALTKESLADFSWKVALGDKTLTEEELKALMEHAGEVVRVGEDFVYLDAAELEAIAKTVESGSEPSYLEKMRAVLTGDLNGAAVVTAPELEARIEAMTDVPEIALPQKLDATLRPYQERGYAWLMKNLRLGLGALIADDMGLGKTLQVIAAMTALKEDGEFKTQKALVVVPTTLLANWARELAKFSPGLTVGTYHGTKRKLPAPEKTPDVTLTSYGTLRRDAKTFASRKWRLLVLDEAQVIKNRSTAQSIAVKSVKAPQVLAMSGTPVENRLMEYWSILSTVQPKLLGSEADFRRTFADPIEREHDERAIAAFRRLTAPFMLRRLKSDPKIISDLPEKNVLDHFTSLTPAQTALYKKTLDEMLEAMKEAEKTEREAAASGGDAEAARMKRKGLVLRLITALKQICNSPSQYQKTEAPTSDSGKGDALLAILGQCRDAERKVLIFTQFREMGEKLQDWIEAAGFGRPAFLHGGVPVKARMAMVDKFQTDRTERVMIISLKAGGTGLNLTSASAVVHYDLWWNPAVEAQATDRAYRIGQRRDVLVYRFVTAGTFEEKINAMLAKKRELADLTVNTGETWIGDLSSTEIREIFRLEDQN